ncbi:hypothetical protein [Mobilicoccus massiliensis]|uniref:hypothetical protein n=1 Tax=Mobilicoccus massiliensis TaxID=1522310 RepID=UPI00058B6810|nr:hypothetical protein [Mobilicoccus massiliensis]
MTRHVFDGRIAGMGTAEGTRLVVGHWPVSPLGSFTDVMVERSNGQRLLLAPSMDVAEFVTATYSFDDVVLTPVTCVVHEGRSTGPAQRWSVEAGPLRLTFTTGGRTLLGALLAAIPRRVATSPAFCRLTDLPARAVGLRTAGTAGRDRLEFYGARDVHTVTSLVASWTGVDLGPLRPVTPPVRFGFGSTPARPSVTTVTTTVVTPG